MEASVREVHCDSYCQILPREFLLFVITLHVSVQWWWEGRRVGGKRMNWRKWGVNVTNFIQSGMKGRKVPCIQRMSLVSRSSWNVLMNQRISQRSGCRYVRANYNCFRIKVIWRNFLYNERKSEDRKAGRACENKVMGGLNLDIWIQGESLAFCCCEDSTMTLEYSLHFVIKCLICVEYWNISIVHAQDRSLNQVKDVGTLIYIDSRDLSKMWGRVG